MLDYLILYKDGTVQTVNGDPSPDLATVIENLKQSEELWDDIEDAYEKGSPQYEEIVQNMPSGPSPEEEQIRVLKDKLANTDYTVIKNAEKALEILAQKDHDIVLDYQETIEARKTYREEINKIEASMIEKYQAERQNNNASEDASE